MKSIKDFIFYFRSCPLCNAWMTLDLDLPIPSMIEIKPDGVLLTIVQDEHKNDREFFISFNDNSIQSSHPFALNDTLSLIKRFYHKNYRDTFKIEARCYSCNDFRYWSKPMFFSPRSKKLSNIGVSGEKAQFHQTSANNEKLSFVIFNSVEKKSTRYIVYHQFSDQKTEFSAPYLSFKKFDFSDKERIIESIQKLSVLC